MGLKVVRQAAQELSDVDEVHLQQDVLKQTQDPQRGPEQRLLAVPTEHVPNSACHVQGEGLTIECEDPGREHKINKSHFIFEHVEKYGRRQAPHVKMSSVLVSSKFNLKNISLSFLSFLIKYKFFHQISHVALNDLLFVHIRDNKHRK